MLPCICITCKNVKDSLLLFGLVGGSTVSISVLILGFVSSFASGFAFVSGEEERDGHGEATDEPLSATVKSTPDGPSSSAVRSTKDVSNVAVRSTCVALFASLRGVSFDNEAAPDNDDAAACCSLSATGFSTVLCSTGLCSTGLCSTGLCSTGLCSTGRSFDTSL